MKLAVFMACMLLSFGAYAVVGDTIKKAIESHTPEKMAQFNARDLARLARNKDEYSDLAREATQKAKSALQRRFDWRDKLRLASGITLTGVGAYLLNNFRGFLTTMNNHGYVEDQQTYVRESAEPVQLAKGGITGPLGVLLLTQGIKQCYRGLSQHDRKQAVVRSLFVKDAVEEWGNAIN